MATSYPTLRLRPLGVGDLLDEALRVYRRHFWLFIGIGAVLLFPLAVLELLHQAVVYTASDVGTVATASVLSPVVSWLVSVAMLLATTYAVSEAYLGRNPTLRSAYGHGLRRYMAAVGLSLLTFLALGLLAITILGIPVAIYLGICWSLALPALLLEGLGIRRALGRSRGLVRGRWWRTLGILILLGIIQGIIQAFFSLPGVLLGVLLLRDASGFGFGFALFSIVGTLAGTLAQVVGGPILYCGLVLLYYDLRVRKEGFDLELLAREVEGASRGRDAL